LKDIPIPCLANEAVAISAIQRAPWASGTLLLQHRGALARNRAESTAAIYDAERLSQGPIFRLIGSEKIRDRDAAPPLRLHWFESQVLT